jgi:hypothetical protein
VKSISAISLDHLFYTFYQIKTQICVFVILFKNENPYKAGTIKVPKNEKRVGAREK